MKSKFIFFLFIVSMSAHLFADVYQNDVVNSTQGTDFWVTFMRNAGAGAGDDGLKLILYATPVGNQNVKLTIRNNNVWPYYYKEYTIRPNATDTIVVPNNMAYLTQSEATSYMALHVTADKPISLFLCNNHNGNSYDASLVLPKPCLGKEYVVQTYKEDRAATEFAIVGTHWDTRVKIIPSASTSDYNGYSHNKGEEFEVYISEGETFFIRSKEGNSDLSGTTICADKPIAVFNGNQHALIPRGSDDHMVEQAVPVPFWGKSFAITKSNKQDYNIVRITAAEDGTVIKRNGTALKTINKLETYSFVMATGSRDKQFKDDGYTDLYSDESCYIETSKPAICYLYLSSNAMNEDMLGDPSMVFITPQEQAIKEIAFTTYKNKPNDEIISYVNIVTTNSNKGKIKLDGIVIPNAQYSAVSGNSNLCFARMEVKNPPAIITGGEFTAYTYGYVDGSDVSYATSTGFNNEVLTAYMLIDGVRTNSTRLCMGNSVKFDAVTNITPKSIKWEFEDNKATNAQASLTHKYDSAGNWNVNLIVERYSPICQCDMFDTIRARVTVDSVKNYNSTMTLCEDKNQTTFTIGNPPVTHNRSELVLNGVKRYDETGLKTIDGCDSARHWSVYYGAVYGVDKPIVHEVNLCEGSAYTYKNKAGKQKTLTEAGVYRDTLATVRCRCDSIVQIKITMKPSPGITDTIVDLCENHYLWHGTTYKESGEYYDTLRAKNGCDSIIRLKLTLGKPYLFKETASVCKTCEGVNYEWRGKILTTAGVHYDSLKTTIGCDSVYQMTLTVNDAECIHDTVTILERELPYRWSRNGQYYNESGDYNYDYRRYYYSCTNYYFLHLTVLNSSNDIKRDTICLQNTGSYTWEGHAQGGGNLNLEKLTAGTHIYWDSLKNVSGGDSVFQLILYVGDTAITHNNYSICQYEPFVYMGETINTDVAQHIHRIDTITSSLGCDSVVELNLDINPVYHDTIRHRMADKDSYTWPATGEVFENMKAGVYEYRHYENTINGCDSTFYLNLKVEQAYQFEEYDTICNDQKYLWHDSIIEIGRAEGEYILWDSLKSQLGQDSLYRMHLVVYQIYKHDETATICDNETYIFHGVEVSYPKYGHYTRTDTLLSIHGCDSIVTLDITVNRTYLHKLEHDTVCSVDGYDWRGKKYFKSGTYFDTVPTIHGCDSVFRIHLELSPAFRHTTTHAMCDNQTYLYEGNLIDRGGDYSWEYVNEFGCDSTYSLHVEVQPTYFFEDTVVLCDNETYTFHGRRLSQAGIYFDSLKTKTSCHCDSVYKVVILKDQSYDIHLYDTICNSIYDFNGRQLTQTGVYVDSLLTHLGCDSIITLHLTVCPSYLFEHTRSACYASAGRWRKYNLNNYDPGEYILYDSLKTVAGNDSVYCLYLTIVPSYYTDEKATICENETYNFLGNELKLDVGQHIITDTVLAIGGCDSIVRLDITVFPTYHRVEIDTTCNQNDIWWHGQHIHASGTYYDTLQTIHGCDSVIELQLHVRQSYYMSFSTAICDNQTFKYADYVFNIPGDYKLTSVTTFGCDSVTEIHIDQEKTYLFEQHEQICGDETYNFRGRILSEAGVYWDSLQTRTSCQCDSVYKLVLDWYPTFDHHIYDTICDNQSLTHDGVEYNQTGDYVLNYQTIHGCDSIVTLHLKVVSTYLHTTYDTICDNEFYSFGKKQYNKTGVYVDSLYTMYGCDSVEILYLQVNPTTETIIYDTICRGSTYSFGGQELTKKGFYTDTVTNEYGCQHVNKLYLETVFTTITGVTLYPICADDKTIDIDFTYKEMRPRWYEITFAENGYEQNFEDVNERLGRQDYLSIQVPVGDTLPMPSKPYFDGVSHQTLNKPKLDYPRPDRYPIHIVFYNGYCEPSPATIVDTAFLVRYPSWIVEQHWNDALFIYDALYNGGHSFDSYQWYKNGKALPGQTGAYLYEPHYLDFGAEYQVVVRRSDDGSVFYTCPISPVLMTDEIMPKKDYISVVPTLLTLANPTAALLCTKAGTYYMYNSSGALVKQDHFEPEYTASNKVADQPVNVMATDIKFPSLQDVYLLKVVTDDGYERTQKIIVK